MARMPLSPEFVNAVMSCLQQPPVLIDIMLGAFFPEVVERQNAFVQSRIATTDRGAEMAAMYDFLHSQFPNSLPREMLPEEKGIDWAFREMVKHVLAAALNVEYRSKTGIVLQ